ncbi:MAG: hypothetical protein IJY14_03190 [Acholeplasmatales bacterium]|nr:hypothetical protein [Acholeplasmatales bacterium]
MRIFSAIIEIITAPFNFLLRTKNYNTPSKLGKPVIVLLVSLIIVAILILYAYYDVLFK